MTDKTNGKPYYIKDGLIYDRDADCSISRKDMETGYVQPLTVERVYEMIDEHYERTGEHVSFDDIAMMVLGIAHENAREEKKERSVIIDGGALDFQSTTKQKGRGKQAKAPMEKRYKLPTRISIDQITTEPVTVTIILFREIGDNKIEVEAFPHSWVVRDDNGKLKGQPLEGEIERFQTAMETHTLMLFPPVDNGVNTLPNIKMAVFAHYQHTRLKNKKGNKKKNKKGNKKGNK